MVVCGDRDPFVPVDHAWGLKRQLPDGRLFVAPDCGHEVMSRKPSLFNEALAGFFRSTATVAAQRAAADRPDPIAVDPVPGEPQPSDNPLAEAPTADPGTASDWLADASRQPRQGGES